MGNNVISLPGLVFFSDYENWAAYEQILYSIYEADFLKSRPNFRALKVSVKYHPATKGRACSFWHLIQQAHLTKKEDDRIPDFRRCERIRWPRAIIEQYENFGVKVWENIRCTAKGSEQSVCLWLEAVDYIVILRKRRDYYLLCTAYPIDREHTRRKLKKEYEASKKAGDATNDDPVTPSTHGR